MGAERWRKGKEGGISNSISISFVGHDLRHDLGGSLLQQIGKTCRLLDFCQDFFLDFGFSFCTSTVTCRYKPTFSVFVHLDLDVDSTQHQPKKVGFY
jgi:hypothetical protein